MSNAALMFSSPVSFCMFDTKTSYCTHPISTLHGHANLKLTPTIKPHSATLKSLLVDGPEGFPKPCMSVAILVINGCTHFVLIKIR